MKKFCLFLCVCLNLFIIAEEKVLPSYLVIAPEGMDDAVVQRVQGWMATNLYYEVRVRRLPQWEGVSAEEQVASLGPIPEPGIVTVVLSPRLEEGKHAVVLPEKQLGFIHVGLLVPEQNEKTLRRLDRQAIRIVGFSLGVPPQPIPFCALFPYKDMEQLDQIGRGFSPPAMAQYRAALEKRGLPLSEAAETFLPKTRAPVPAPELPKE